MPLDGLRAWIGEVERKLGVRTRVFLVLAVIAIGGAGAAIYLAIDAQDNAVSESDVQALQQDLEARIDEGGTGAGAAQIAQLEVELKSLQAQVKALESKGSGVAGGKGTSSGGDGTGGVAGPGGNDGSETAGGEDTEGSTDGLDDKGGPGLSGALDDPGASSATGGNPSSKVQDLLDKATEQIGQAR